MTRQYLRWTKRAGGVLLLGVLLAACGGSSDPVAVAESSDTETPTVEPATPVEETEPTPAADQSVEEPTPAAAEDEPTPQPTAAADEQDDDLSRTKPAEGELVDPGSTVQFDQLGTPVSFALDVPWQVAIAGEGAIAISPPGADGPFGPTAVIMRPSGFASGNELTQEPPVFQFSGDSTDWLANSGIEVGGGPTEVIVDGYSALLYQVTVPETAETFGPCGPAPQDRCIFFATSLDQGLLSHTVMRTARSASIWVIEQGVHAPLVIVASAPDGDEDWIDSFDTSLANTLELGEPAPAPGSDVSERRWEEGRNGPVPAGELTFPLLGGVTLNLPVDAVAIQGGDCLLFDFGEMSGLIISRIGQDSAATPVTTVEEYQSIDAEAITPAATGRIASFLGVDLMEYEFELAGELAEPRVACAPLGSDPRDEIWIAPYRYATEFVAPTEGGVYLVGTAAEDADRFAEMKDLLDEILPTIRSAE